MQRPRLDVLAPEWGSTVHIPDNPLFKPRYTLIHWGGLTAHVPPEDEQGRIRSWQLSHMGRMTDIAYQILVGDSGTSYEGRSWRSGGATSKTDYTPEGDRYSAAAVDIVWIGGKHAGPPSDAALVTIGRICRDLGNPVKGHRTVKQENGSYTECPGPDWIEWIDQEGWKVYAPPKPWALSAWKWSQAAGITTADSNPYATVTKQEMAAFLRRTVRHIARGGTA